MSGKITFHFDDGFLSHYTKVFPIFKKHGIKGCIGLSASFKPGNAMTDGQALEMQSAGWEVLCHATDHVRLSEYDPELEIKEIISSKRTLESRGFKTGAFLTPMSECHPRYRPVLEENYDAAFTVYTNSKEIPVEKLVIKRPVSFYELNRACMAGKTVCELKAYVDYVSGNDAWLNFYDHDIAVGENVTENTLEEIVLYCLEKDVRIVTVREAIDDGRVSVNLPYRAQL